MAISQDNTGVFRRPGFSQEIYKHCSRTDIAGYYSGVGLVRDRNTGDRIR
jgi:hypothetical protein